eukprot:3592214-Pleurochrysis_carterae.AAC.1
MKPRHDKSLKKRPALWVRHASCATGRRRTARGQVTAGTSTWIAAVCCLAIYSTSMLSPIAAATHGTREVFPPTSPALGSAHWPAPIAQMTI